MHRGHRACHRGAHRRGPGRVRHCRWGRRAPARSSRSSASLRAAPSARHQLRHRGRAGRRSAARAPGSCADAVVTPHVALGLRSRVGASARRATVRRVCRGVSPAWTTPIVAMPAEKHALCAAHRGDRRRHGIARRRGVCRRARHSVRGVSGDRRPGAQRSLPPAASRGAAARRTNRSAARVLRSLARSPASCLRSCATRSMHASHFARSHAAVDSLARAWVTRISESFCSTCRENTYCAGRWRSQRDLRRHGALRVARRAG